ncbi:MAG: ATP-dependent RNA helicase HrpA [Polyangiaceae bacterium]|nr:ATP-dependent RNA helicase HrpA [Polyangiaceae bacterium]
MTPPSDSNRVQFPSELPISAHVVEIAKAVNDHQVVIVAGETGSGKSTQLPKICLAMGRGVDARIGVTQPRRIAATSLAVRVAKELNVEVGREVGYQIRFADRTGPHTYVKLMTDGILLAEIQNDPSLRQYDTLIIDEAHERSLNIDFLLGYLKRLLPKRPHLRVIVSSATLEIERFSAFFGKAPVVSVSGRTFPVDVLHRPPRDDEGELSTLVANAVFEVTELDPRGDILVFLPGEREIREVMDDLSGRGLKHTVILPLHGRLPQADQQRVFLPLSERRIVLATNVAETSLTIPGIVYVVDSGLARLNRYDTRTGVTRLKVETISQASADQRKGRAGRIEAGVCVRLCTPEEDVSRTPYTDPEILRVGLSSVILRMLALGLGKVEQFPFLDMPPKRAIEEGIRVLEELGALTEEGELTDVGRKLADLPLDPRIGRMLLSGAECGALREVLILAAALGIQDPRDRPLAAQKQADEAHKRFADEGSDFAGLLKLWAFWQNQKKLTKNQAKKACRDAFVSFNRMREWEDVHGDLNRSAREMGFIQNETPASGEAIHRALLPGLLSRIGTWMSEPKVYLGARQMRFWPHPSSGLFKKPPQWVMAAELVETTKLYARNVARVEPAWIEDAAGPLAKRRYTDPHWSEKSAQVMAKEQVTVYGLPVVRDRSVHYGPIDPKSSRRLFIIHALVRHEYKTQAAFFAHNEGVFAEARRRFDKARKSDMLADEDVLTHFFEARLPDDVVSGKTFERFRKEAEAKDPKRLFLSLEDVLGESSGELSTQLYPDELTLLGVKLPLHYKFDPPADDDGVTIEVPLPVLGQLDSKKMEHTIPGWQQEKVLLLLESLPKAARKQLGPLKEMSAVIAPQLRAFEEPFLAGLSRLVFELSGVRVPVTAVKPHEVPPCYSFYYRVVDEFGHVVGQGRNLEDLQTRLAIKVRESWDKARPTGLERDGLTGFTVDRLPETVTVQVGPLKVTGYPALVDAQTTVNVRVLSTQTAAEDATRAGLRRCYLLLTGSSISKLEQSVSNGVAGGAIAERAGTGEWPPRRQIAVRAFDEAFCLDGSVPLPRTREAFQTRLLEGRGRLSQVVTTLSKAAQEIALELGKVDAMLRGLRGKPGAPKTSLDDVERQLQHLVAPGCLRFYTKERLAHIPRYLRAAALRLERLPNGPQKDQAKAEQVYPYWKEYLEKKNDLLLRGVPADELDSYRWLLEEWRVSVFAPELRAAVPVSVQRLEEQWKVISSFM